MADSAEVNPRQPEAAAGQAGGQAFRRSVGLLSATAINTRYHHHWPFGPKQIREVFLEEQREHPGQVAMERGAQ